MLVLLFWWWGCWGFVVRFVLVFAGVGGGLRVVAWGGVLLFWWAGFFRDLGIVFERASIFCPQE
ncbi:hypothetical protein RA272_27975, partial [Pseudomonas syringae pv. tagetis]